MVIQPAETAFSLEFCSSPSIPPEGPCDPARIPLHTEVRSGAPRQLHTDSPHPSSECRPACQTLLLGTAVLLSVNNKNKQTDRQKVGRKQEFQNRLGKTQN